MKVEVNPRRFSVVPGEPAVLTVSVSNTGGIISGHRVRVLGVDPRWVSLDQDRLSLFPDSAGVCVVTLTLPRGVPAGPRTVSIEVTELTPPHEREIVSVEVTVPAEPGLKLAVDPVSVTGGRSAAVAVLVENTGNAPIDVALDGREETGEVQFRFDDPAPAVAPGEHRVGAAVLRAPRPWFGSPKVRPYTVVAGPPGAPVVAAGTWLQKARLSRGALALTGLLAAATVFAVVIAVALSQVVSNSNADRNLALQVAEAAQAGNAKAGTAGISGVVTEEATGTPVGGVTVDIYQSNDPTTPIVSTATGASGAYHFSGLAAGSYLLQFQGAGFASLWYPDSLTPASAMAVTVKSGQSVSAVDITLGGLPGTISGQVVGADPSGAVLTLEIPGAGGAQAAAAAAVNAAPPATPSSPAPAAAAATPTTTAGGAATGASLSAASSDPSAPPTPAAQGAGPTIVTSQTLSSTGDFTLANVPSPGTFDLVVVKAGYAPAVAEVDLAGGESRSGVVITLHKGDGSISGTVSTAAGPLGGATIAASDGTSTVSSVSETTPGSVGDFQLDNLPTPDTLTVVVTAAGYASQTLSVSLAAHQQLTGLSVVLVPGSGSISGTVTTAGQPAGGVTVTATNGQQTVSTVTLSIGNVGTYQLSGLVSPGAYTLTFSRPDLTSQTRAVSLTTSQPAVTGVDADLVADTASVYGTITQTNGQPVHQVTVQLSSGTTTYQVISADSPTPGAYEIDGVAPGTYTISFTRQGGQPTSSIISLVGGQRFEYNPQLTPAASIYGRVVQESNPTQAVPDAQVTLYLATQYPTVSVATVLTDSSGDFTFENVDAPQNFVVGVAFPQGSSNQETVVVQTVEGQAVPVCGSEATGQVGAGPSPTTTTAGGQCDPTTDPLEVATP
ncbi:MAG TPA: carboxypeptidase-like regulatory domain-containing protein [Acidimicrobiales bacterium]|nr:carboxypeptidase-like regulatory domain-containing protein [Acidimicrobiales bacterium]